MSDRLAELVRQRALVAEHLAWLDRQIAEAALKPPAPAQAVAPARHPSALATAPLVGPAGTGGALPVPPEADDMFAQYRVHPAAMKNDVRKGCLLYFTAAFVALGLGIMVFYLLWKPR